MIFLKIATVLIHILIHNEKQNGMKHIVYYYFAGDEHVWVVAG